MHYIKIVWKSYSSFGLEFGVRRWCDFVKDYKPIAEFIELEDAEKFANIKAIELGVEIKNEAEKELGEQKSKKKKNRR